MWSIWWDELTVASIIDPTVIRNQNRCTLDVDIGMAPNMATRSFGKRPTMYRSFFLPTAGRGRWIVKNGSVI